MEQIKERNKPLQAKREAPKAPFFLFDIDKVVMENDAQSDLLKEQFYTKNKKDSEEKKKTPGEMQDAVTLKSLLKANSEINFKAIMDYIKNLSPSGIELEFMSLSTFELNGGSNSQPNLLVSIYNYSFIFIIAFSHA